MRYSGGIVIGSVRYSTPRRSFVTTKSRWRSSCSTKPSRRDRHARRTIRATAWRTTNSWGRSRAKGSSSDTCATARRRAPIAPTICIGLRCTPRFKVKAADRSCSTRSSAVFVERVDHAVDDVELLDRGHVLLPHRVADLLDRAQDVRRETHLEIVERRLQAFDIDDVGPVPISELVEGIDALVEDLLPVTHARRLRGSVEGSCDYEGRGLRRLTYTTRASPGA